MSQQLAPAAWGHRYLRELAASASAGTHLYPAHICTLHTWLQAGAVLPCCEMLLGRAQEKHSRLQKACFFSEN